MNKIDITIKDVSLDQASEILTRIKGIAGVTVASSGSSETATTGHVMPIFLKNAQGQQQPTGGVATGFPVQHAPAAVAAQTEEDEGGAPAGDVNGVDSEGLPWDERIHSSSKKHNKAGGWVKRKNVPESTFNQVIGELRSRAPVMPLGQPAYNPQPQQNFQPAQNFAPVQNFAPANTAPVHAPAYNPQPQQNFQPAAPAAPVAVQQDINALFSKIQNGFQTGSMNTEYMNSLITRMAQTFQLQVNSINDIAGRPDMIDWSFRTLAADGK